MVLRMQADGSLLGPWARARSRTSGAGGRAKQSLAGAVGRWEADGAPQVYLRRLARRQMSVTLDVDDCCGRARYGTVVRCRCLPVRLSASCCGQRTPWDRCSSLTSGSRWRSEGCVRCGGRNGRQLALCGPCVLAVLVDTLYSEGEVVWRWRWSGKTGRGSEGGIREGWSV